jgi:hypothetical protein
MYVYVYINISICWETASSYREIYRGIIIYILRIYICINVCTYMYGYVYMNICIWQETPNSYRKIRRGIIIYVLRI